MKILCVHVQYPPAAREQRRNHVLEAASAGTQVEFREIQGELFKLAGNTELIRNITAPQVVEAAKEAERLGFDAVLPYGGLDLGVDAARCYVDIPVVGMGRSGLSLAANMTSRIAVMVYGVTSIPAIRKFVRETGLGDFVVVIEPVDVRVPDMLPGNAAFRDALLAAGRRVAREEGAEAIVPLGTSFLPTNAFAAEMSAAAGIPFINCVAAGLKAAETMVAMGLRNSRLAYPRAG